MARPDEKKVGCGETSPGRRDDGSVFNSKSINLLPQICLLPEFLEQSDPINV